MEFLEKKAKNSVRLPEEMIYRLIQYIIENPILDVERAKNNSLHWKEVPDVLNNENIKKDVNQWMRVC